MAWNLRFGRKRDLPGGLWLHHELMVIGLEMIRHTPGVGQLV